LARALNETPRGFEVNACMRARNVGVEDDMAQTTPELAGSPNRIMTILARIAGVRRHHSDFEPPVKRIA